MKRILILLLLIFSVSFIHSENDGGKYLFSSGDITNDDLYLYLEGSWKFDLSTIINGNILSLLENFTFSQTPNISASIWLFNKYFFETQILENSDDNLFLLGYENPDGSLLKQIRIGNSDLESGTYAGFSPPLPNSNFPGLRVKLENENSTQEFVGIYSAESSEHLKYRGYNLIQEESLPINEYTRGRLFRLPFNYSNNLKVFITDKNSETEELSNQSYIYNSDDSTLYIIDELDNLSQIEIEYPNLETSNIKTLLNDFVQPTENPGIESALTEDQIYNLYNSDNNRLTIYKSGIFYPFEVLGLYNFEILDPKNSYNIYLDNTKVVNSFIDSNGLTFVNPDLETINLINRYPFFNIDKNIYKNGGGGFTSDHILKIETLTPVKNFVLPSTPKENSIVININGVVYSGYTYDSNSNTINLDQKISPLDEVEIIYSIDSEGGNRNLLLNYGGLFKFSDNFNIELSLTGSWDFAADDYSYIYGENSGGVSSGIKLNYNNNNLSASLLTNVQIINPDTTKGYSLLNYTEESSIIPITSTTLLPPTKGFIKKRKESELYLTVEDILKLDEIESGGGYFSKNISGNNGYNVVVLETDIIPGGEERNLRLNLEDYRGDYSWATSFHLDIMNYGDSKNLDIEFYNINNPTLLVKKAIAVSSSDTYKAYSVDFTNSERELLSSIDELRFNIPEGSANIFLIKGLQFQGDDFVRNNSSEDFKLTKSDKSIKIESLSSGSDIQFSKNISNISLDNYESLTFNIENSGLLNTLSSFTLNLKKGNLLVKSLIIPGSSLTTSNNIIKVDNNSGEIFINGDKQDIVVTNYISSSISNIEIVLSNYSLNSSILLSEIILSEPKIGITNSNKFTLEYTPDFSLQLLDRDFIHNIKFLLYNDFEIADKLNNRLDLNLSFDVFNNKIASGIEITDKLSAFNYDLVLPIISNVITLEDSFNYNEMSFRSTLLNINTPITDLTLNLSRATNSDATIKESSFEVNLVKTDFLTISNSLSNNQKSSIVTNNLSNEIINSYIDLLPSNNIELSNNLENNLNFTVGNRYLNVDSNIGSTIIQNNSEYSLNNSNNYFLSSSLKIDLEWLTLTPYIGSGFTISEKSRNNTVYNAISNYFNTDIGYPFTLGFSNIFFTDNNSNFYFDSSSKGKTLDSNLSVTLENKTTFSTLQWLIPSKITYDLNKIFTQKNSFIETLLINTLKVDFLESSIIKNSLTLSNKYNIENISNNLEALWSLNIYREFKKDYILDLNSQLNLEEGNITEVFTTEFSWPGKSGPIFIVPIFDKLFNSPYNYIHREGLYLSFDQSSSDYSFGLSHKTELNIKDSNQTNFIVNLDHISTESALFILELGLNTTLIF